MYGFEIKVLAIILLAAPLGLFVEAKKEIFFNEFTTLAFEILPLPVTNETQIHAYITGRGYGTVVLGFNNKASPLGSDLFIGGVGNDSNAWGGDYYLPPNANDTTLPINDTVQDWHIKTSNRAGENFSLTLVRYLNTTDIDHDLVIGEDMYVLWKYIDNATSYNDINGFTDIVKTALGILVEVGCALTGHFPRGVANRSVVGIGTVVTLAVITTLSKRLIS